LEQNTFKTFTLKFFQRLQAQGHSTSKLAQLLLKAATPVDVSSIPVPKPPNNTVGSPDGTCFLHLRFHAQDIPRQDIQQRFSAICIPTFQEVGFDVHRMIVAYSRAPNISDNFWRNRLDVSVNTTLVVSGSAVFDSPVSDQQALFFVLT
jgi:hypothetical protein